MRDLTCLIRAMINPDNGADNDKQCKTFAETCQMLSNSFNRG